MFHMLAGVIGEPVLSIHPRQGRDKAGMTSAALFRSIYNRPIYPPNPGTKLPKIAIMWCRGDRHLNNVPNHFVSVVSYVHILLNLL
jgi:hypothetical protein